MKIRLNREGDKVYEYNVLFETIYQTLENLFVVELSDEDLIIAMGDSGSPILTLDGRIAGVVSYGIYGNKKQILARSIEDVLSQTMNNRNTKLYSPNK